MFPKKFSSTSIKWLMRLYPPLLLSGVWVQKIEPNFLGAQVRIRKTLLNLNANGSIFGGSLYVATDPFYVLLLHQYFTNQGYHIRAWLKSGRIDYIKPIKSSLVFHFELSLEDIKRAEIQLKENGKFIETFRAIGKNAEGEIYVLMEAEVYIRDLNFNS